MQITKDTKLTVSLAAKQNNIGAAMTNAGYQALNLNFIHVPITTLDIASAITGVRGFNLAGCTVSMPHKQQVIKYLDKVDDVGPHVAVIGRCPKCSFIGETGTVGIARYIVFGFMVKCHKEFLASQTLYARSHSVDPGVTTCDLTPGRSRLPVCEQIGASSRGEINVVG